MQFVDDLNPTLPAAELPPLAMPGAKNDSELLHPAVREFFSLFGKALKSIALYQHLPQKFPEYLGRPFAALTELLAHRDALSVKVEPHDFLFGNQSVLPVELRESLAYRFFRDGVRRLTFRAGITLDEFGTFAFLTTRRPREEADNESLLEALWAADLAHVEQLVVESLDIPNVSAEAVEVAVDQIVAYLAHSLRSEGGDDHVSAARLRASDLELKLTALEQSRALEVEAGLIAPDLKVTLQAEILEEESHLGPTVVRALLETVADGVQPMELQDLRAFLTRLLDALLLQEDFAAILRIADRLSQLDPPLDEALYAFFREKMGEADRLGRIAAVVRQGVLRQRRELARYLVSLSPQVVPVLLRELETIDQPEGRELLRDALAVIGRDTPEPFVARLAAANSTLAVDVLHILARQRVPGRVRYLEQALQNPNPAVRLEVVTASKALHPEAARALLLLALRDESPKVRAAAAQRLGESGIKGCYLELQPFVTDAGFFEKSAEERRALYFATASTRDRAALDLLLARIARPNGIFGGRKHADDRQFAMEALGSWPSMTVCEAILAVAEDKKNPSELRDVALKVAQRAQALLEQSS